MMNVLKVPLHPYCNSNGVWQKASNAGQVMEDLKDHNIKQGGELTIMKTLKIKINKKNSNNKREKHYRHFMRQLTWG